jgi:hypothetical protein
MQACIDADRPILTRTPEGAGKVPYSQRLFHFDAIRFMCKVLGTVGSPDCHIGACVGQSEVRQIHRRWCDRCVPPKADPFAGPPRLCSDTKEHLNQRSEL